MDEKWVIFMVPFKMFIHLDQPSVGKNLEPSHQENTCCLCRIGLEAIVSYLYLQSHMLVSSGSTTI